MDIWQEAMEAAPTERESYLLKAEALISEKKHKEALDTLLQLESVKDQDWPDAQYFLGYLYYEMRRYDDARRHLEKAHELGYPYSGLRDKVLKLTK